ncbi:hypothetical protein RO787_25975, partial [Blautia coccoides]|uniref:hypothetical protein n=1 Tax=Blautia producta TaxID=33035 RepID=UPI0028A2FC13
VKLIKSAVVDKTAETQGKCIFTTKNRYAILNKYEYSPDSGIGNSDRFLIRGDYKKIWRNIQ